MFLLSYFTEICFATPFICMFFKDKNIIIWHLVAHNKMILSLRFCPSGLCHINSPNLAPPDLKPPLVWPITPHLPHPKIIYRKTTMFPSGFPSCYWAAEKSPFCTTSSQGNFSQVCVFSNNFYHCIPFSSLRISGLNIAKIPHPIFKHSGSALIN